MVYIVYKPPTVDWMPEAAEVSSGKRAAFTVADMAQCAGASLDPRPELLRSGIAKLNSIRGVTLDYLARLLQHVVGPKGGQVRIVDGDCESLECALEAVGGLAQVQAVFGSAISANFPELLRVFYRLANRGVPCVAGGIHLTARPQDLDRYLRPFLAPNAAPVAAVVGPCDAAVMSTIVADLAQDRLQARYAGGINIEERYWQRFPWRAEGKSAMRCIEVSRGCPYSCPFCSISVLPVERRRLQVRDIEDVLSEMCSNGPRDSFIQRHLRVFIAENVAAQRSVFSMLLEQMSERAPAISFLAQADCLVALDPAFLKALRKAGCVSLLIGFESLNEQNLEAIRKKSAFALKRKLGCSDMRQAYAEATRRIQDEGMSIRGAFIFGLPQDRPGCGNEVGDFLQQFNLLPHLTALTALPGTELFERTLRPQLLYKHPDDWPPNAGPYPAAFSGMDLTETNLATNPEFTPQQVQAEISAVVARFQGASLLPVLKTFAQALRTAGARSWKAALIDSVVSAGVTRGFFRAAPALVARINEGTPSRPGALRRLGLVQEAAVAAAQAAPSQALQAACAS